MLRLRFLALVVFGAVLLASAFVLAGPASQPASAPAIPAFWPLIKAWLIANWRWIVLAALIPSLLTGLRKKSLREGVIGFLETLLERCSLATPKDSPGTFKWPLVKADPPAKTGPDKPPQG